MSGDVHYPGWCCRQIAAQLSQALFTMADLHAQVSDLREENRQLKFRIESVTTEKSENTSPDKKNKNPMEGGSVANIASLQCSKPVNKESAKETNPPLLVQGFNASSVNSLCHNELSSFESEQKQERTVLNIPTKHDADVIKREASVTFGSQASGDFKCEKCECSFSSSDQLTSHLAVHIGRSFHVCKVCNAMFLLKADLHRHLATHPNVKQYICQLCGKAYTSKNNYKLHIKTHTGVGLYPCDVCGKAFHSENHLNVHRRIHTGERPFECQYCDKSFTQKSGLINHTRLHTGEKPFVCPSCPKAFTQKSNLNFHLSKHHPIPENVSTIPIQNVSPIPIQNVSPIPIQNVSP